MDPLEDELRILFIDDEPLQLDLLRRILNVVDPKMEIDILSDPTKTVEKILKTDYDCVVLDQKMPFVSGSEIISMIKQVKDIPCIIYTGYEVSEVELESLESGADKVISKILNANFYPHLVKTVRETIQKYKN